MTQRYRDLPAVAFAPAPVRRLERPEGAQWDGLSISLQGDLYLAYFREGIGSTILAGDGQEIGLKPPERDALWFPFVQRFTDGRWLVVESRTKGIKPNGHVFESDGTFSYSFYAGDGIQTVLVDQSDRIWIGYFDEGVFGSFDAPPELATSALGPEGLVRLSDRGELEFGFNDTAADRNISDIYALTIDDSGRVWLCPYNDFYVASVDGDTIDFPLALAPAAGAPAMTVGPEHLVFFGGYDRDCMVTVVERATQRLRLIQLRGQDGGPLSPQRLATRGTMAVALADDWLYRLDLDLLLEALGPWLDTNSSSVESAVMYMEEEASYTSYTEYDAATGEIRKHPGKARPIENQPRDDSYGEP